MDYRFVLQNDKSDFVDDVFDLEEKRDFEIRRDYVNYFRALNDIQDHSLDFAIVDEVLKQNVAYEILPKIGDFNLTIVKGKDTSWYLNN